MKTLISTKKFSAKDEVNFAHLNRLGAFEAGEVSIPDLFNFITAGHAWRSAIYKPTAKSYAKSNVAAMGSLALDFDEVELNPSKAVEKLGGIGFPPNFWYYTYSQGIKPGNNFRMVWVFDTEFSVKEYSDVYFILTKILFNEADQVTHDPSRIWLGTNGDGRIINNQITPITSMGHIVATYEEEINKVKSVRNRKTFGIDKMKDMVIPDSVKVNQNWFETLASVSPVARKWRDGQYLDQMERKNLILNIKYIDRPEKWTEFMSYYNPEAFAAEDSNFYGNEMAYIHSEARRTSPPFPIIPTNEGWITAAEWFQKENIIIDVRRSHKLISLDEHDIQMAEKFDEMTQRPTKGITYFQSATGSGKTEHTIRFLAKQPYNQAKYVYVVPNHGVREDFINRWHEYREKHGNPTVLFGGDPNIVPKTKYNYKTKRFERTEGVQDNIYTVGRKDYTERQLRQMALGIRPDSFAAETEDELERAESIKKLMMMDNGIYVITQQLFSYMKDLKADMVIIDENPNPSLIDEWIVPIKEIAYLADTTFLPESRNKILEYHNKMVEIIRDLRANNDYGKLIDVNEFNELLELVDKERVISNPMFQSRLFRFTEMEGDSKNSFKVIAAEQLHGREPSLTMTNLHKKGVPVFILSATPARTELQTMYPDIPIRLIKVEEAKSKGEIYWFPRETGAKGVGGIKVKDLFQYAKDTFDTYNLDVDYVITFKDQIEYALEQGFNVPIMPDGSYIHLYNSEGIDTLKNKKIAIIGKFDVHPSYYNNLWLEWGEKGKPTMANQRMELESSGIKYTTFLYQDERMRNIQLDNIQEKSIQAAGRARALRESTNVYLFSNIPFEGITKMEL